ncbi:hypothetical protein ACBJ59_61120 [Nonomuraea sp. MTCD27]|uniref:hypothetical protein n=1 Tax=Nonomuraea sp. MTCD27 TaxID=1676747 RepID=UPI0035C14E33
MIQTTDPPVSSASPEQGSTLATAAQSFNWTRQTTPRVRAALTTWLEIGDRAFRCMTIVPPTGGAR